VKTWSIRAGCQSRNSCRRSHFRRLCPGEPNAALHHMMAAVTGASAAPKEDERFLRGRGQYVGDFHVPSVPEVAFMRSPVAHGGNPLPKCIMERGHERPGYHIATAVQIFRGRMHDDVGAELDRPRQNRRGDVYRRQGARQRYGQSQRWRQYRRSPFAGLSTQMIFGRAGQSKRPTSIVVPGYLVQMFNDAFRLAGNNDGRTQLRSPVRRKYFLNAHLINQMSSAQVL
jgi:hypothetical protein